MLTVNAMIIYKITNQINNKIYIGQSVNTLNDRWKDYVRDTKYLKPELVKYRPIIAAMRKYGIENFNIEIIEDGIVDLRTLDDREIYYIAYYQSTNPEIGYNVQNGGHGSGKHSEVSKKKISEAQLGEKNHMYGKTGALNVTSKKILDVTTGAVYGSAMEAARELGFKPTANSKISACARGVRHTTQKHIFRYLDENNEPIFVNLTFEKIFDTTYEILDETTGIKYETAEAAMIGLQCSKTTIYRFIRGRVKTVKGHQLKCLGQYNIWYYRIPKEFDLVLDEYKYLIVNTVPSPSWGRCNDHPGKE